MKPIPTHRLFVFLALAVLFVGGFVYMYENADPPGYCRTQQRYISDQEFLKSSIAMLYWDMNRVVRNYPDGKTGKKKDLLNLYIGMDFDPKNPNCCSVGRELYPSVVDRFLGIQEITVRLNRKTSTAGPVGMMGDGFYEFRYSSCGNLLNSSPGLPDTSSEKITTTNYLEITNRN